MTDMNVMLSTLHLVYPPVTNYRIVHDSLLAWVNTMPTEPVRSRW